MSHPLEGVAAAVGQLDALLGVADGPGHVAGRQGQLAEVAGAVGGVLPVLLGNIGLQPRLHRLDRLRQPAQRPQVEAGLVQDEALVGLGQPVHRPAPGRVEEAGQGGQVGAERAELLRAEILVAPLNPPPVHLVQRLLVPAGPAAVRHRRVERRHLLDRVGVFRRHGFVVLVQPAVRLPPGGGDFAPQLLAEVLADQGVGVQRVGAVLALRRDQLQPAQLWPGDAASPPPTGGRTCSVRPGMGGAAARRRAPRARQAGRTAPACCSSSTSGPSPKRASNAAITRRGMSALLLGHVQIGDLCCAGDGMPRKLVQVGGQQAQRQGVAAEVARGLLQFGVGALHAADPQQRPARLGGDLLQVLLPGASPGTPPGRPPAPGW